MYTCHAFTCIHTHLFHYSNLLILACPIQSIDDGMDMVCGMLFQVIEQCEQ